MRAAKPRPPSGAAGICGELVLQGHTMVLLRVFTAESAPPLSRCESKAVTASAPRRSHFYSGFSEEKMSVVVLLNVLTNKRISGQSRRKPSVVGF